MTPFVVVAGAAAVVATALARRGLDPERHERDGASRRSRRRTAAVRKPRHGLTGAIRRRTGRIAPLLVLGSLGALAYAVENAHQSWSALYLQDELGAEPAVAAAGPAVFAAVIAVTRFASASMAARRPTVVIVAGAALAATAIAALFPTLMSVLTERAPERRRGGATSVLTTVAYLGFIAGPVYVGTWAGAVGLPGAMLAVAGLAAGLALLAGAGLRRARRARGAAS